MLYAFNENFILPLSHDEVVHGKHSLIAKMPGDDMHKFANLRLLYGYFYAHPGKKLLFMGLEIAQWNEWWENTSIDWHLLQYAPHQGIQRLVKDLNHLYAKEPALHEVEFEWQGFEWLEVHDADASVLAFLRRGRRPEDFLAVVCNFTPVVARRLSSRRPGARLLSRRFSTPTPLTILAATSATSAASAPNPSPGAAARTPSRLSSRLSRSCTSSPSAISAAFPKLGTGKFRVSQL